MGEEDCILKTYPITATADRQNDSGSSSSEQMEVETQIDSIGLHPLERANGRESYDFYCFLIWPFVEASWLGNLSLFMLTPPTSLSSPTKNTNATSDTQDNGIWLDLKLVQTKAQLLLLLQRNPQQQKYGSTPRGHHLGIPQQAISCLKGDYGISASVSRRRDGRARTDGMGRA